MFSYILEDETQYNISLKQYIQNDKKKETYTHMISVSSMCPCTCNICCWDGRQVRREASNWSRDVSGQTGRGVIVAVLCRGLMGTYTLLHTCMQMHSNAHICPNSANFSAGFFLNCVACHLHAWSASTLLQSWNRQMVHSDYWRKYQTGNVIKLLPRD